MKRPLPPWIANRQQRERIVSRWARGGRIVASARFAEPVLIAEAAETSFGVTFKVAPDGMVMCPHCKGYTSAVVFINGGPDISTHRQELRECTTCGGNGGITSDHLGRIQLGHAMRIDRVARGALLSEEAARLGITVPELSALERGRTP